MSNIVSSNERKSQSKFEGTVDRFVRKFKIGSLLKRCNGCKQKGIPALKVFIIVLSLAFRGCSMYMSQRNGTWEEGMSKNTVCRLLNNPGINWERFQVLLAEKAVSFIAPLTSEERVNTFIADDTLYGRDRAKKAELLSRVYDHNAKKHLKGYRCLTLGWSDGVTFVPTRAELLASANDENIIGPVHDCDGRSLGAKRRKSAREKATDEIVKFIIQARAAGIPGKHLLADSWFFSPKMAKTLLRKVGVFIISMAKKTTKMKYQIREGDQTMMLDVKEIFARYKKRRGRSRFLLSVEVWLGEGEDAIRARLVFVRNRNKRKEWLVLVTTDMSLTEEEIIRLYGRRWEIETFFKVCKQYLQLLNGCHSLSYDALTAHLTVVLARYTMLAVEQRCNMDERTLGDLFLYAIDEMHDLSYAEALMTLFTILFKASSEGKLTSEKLEEYVDEFIHRLPGFIQCLLTQKMCA